ncbi:prepilin-type N-terminal cleavage/methylation domain-containing protein [Silvimonas soli]|uniref:prepilin-type N-terminal cleavage/methylation domain-containing protein n=1 Tax=Silvimonas soli TaxID=2980100 RepID=UPI0024B37FCF|nr:prepilin-type N-terminal cleavage/methylation domain-containing protein [Silvimonas soli]
MASPRHNGFSLVEMAVVLAVLGLLMAGALGAIRLSQEVQRARSTQDQLAAIKQTLLGYAVRNGRLPCAAQVGAEATGLEMREATTGRCAYLQGYLPWATLGLGHVDAWGRPFTYRVSEAFAGPNTNKSEEVLLAPGMVFHLLTLGDLEIYPSANSQDYLASAVAVVIVSHGAHGPGPLEGKGNADELVNASDSKMFISKPRIDEPATNAYDDLTEWINPSQLIAEAISAGRLP